MNDLIPDKPKKAGKPPVSRPPEKCMVDGCKNDTEVVVMLVRSTVTNKQYAGRPGQYVFVSKGEWNMRDGYKFDQYVTRCSICYNNDYQRYTAARA